MAHTETEGWVSNQSARSILADVLANGIETTAPEIEITGSGDLASTYSVTDLAVASIGAAGLAAANLLFTIDGNRRNVRVDRRLASFWFASSIRPICWTLPSPWDAIAGDYLARDGWIRLHTNAPRHKEAALRVLGVDMDRAKVAAAVATWDADALEEAIVEAGGCAAKMHSTEEWLAGEQGKCVRSEPLVHWQDIGPAPTLKLSADTSKPLAGLRVLDLTRVLAGPVSTRFLALLGADVLRIDPMDWDEPAIVPDIMLGKRTARLDLHKETDRKRFTALLAQSDILVHGYRPGAIENIGFGEDVRRSIKLGLIEITLDAYGWTGPWKNRRGFDSLVQMSSGIAEAGMRRFGRDRPTPLPVQALDHATGYLMAFATLEALTHSLKTGRAMRARLSLARTGMLLSCYPLAGGIELAAEEPNDRSAAIEHTGWGPANRLKPPVAIEGVPLIAERPAMPIGTNEAAW